MLLLESSVSIVDSFGTKRDLALFVCWLPDRLYDDCLLFLAVAAVGVDAALSGLGVLPVFVLLMVDD